MVSVGKMMRLTVVVLYLAAGFFILPSFLFNFPFTQPFVSSVTSLSAWYMGQALIYTGVIFLIDMGWSMLDISGNGGLTRNVTYGAILFGGSAIFSIAFGLLIFFNQYTMTNTFVNFLIVAELALGIGSVVWHSRAVIWSKKPIMSTVYTR